MSATEELGFDGDDESSIPSDDSTSRLDTSLSNFPAINIQNLSDGAKTHQNLLASINTTKSNLIKKLKPPLSNKNKSKRSTFYKEMKVADEDIEESDDHDNSREDLNSVTVSVNETTFEQMRDSHNVSNFFYQELQ